MLAYKDDTVTKSIASFAGGTHPLCIYNSTANVTEKYPLTSCTSSGAAGLRQPTILYGGKVYQVAQVYDMKRTLNLYFKLFSVQTGNGASTGTINPWIDLMINKTRPLISGSTYHNVAAESRAYPTQFSHTNGTCGVSASLISFQRYLASATVSTGYAWATLVQGTASINALHMSDRAYYLRLFAELRALPYPTSDTLELNFENAASKSTSYGFSDSGGYCSRSMSLYYTKYRSSFSYKYSLQTLGSRSILPHKGVTLSANVDGTYYLGSIQYGSGATRSPIYFGTPVANQWNGMLFKVSARQTFNTSAPGELGGIYTLSHSYNTWITTIHSTLTQSWGTNRTSSVHWDNINI